MNQKHDRQQHNPFLALVAFILRRKLLKRAITWLVPRISVSRKVILWLLPKVKMLLQHGLMFLFFEAVKSVAYHQYHLNLFA
jgi:hypothetical protein